MAFHWTKEQEQVIWSRNRNLLVSAAAGSGKTAVLVERIIQMVTDEKTPLSMDQLLVMTFTNAAAAEMRERVAGAIEKKLEEQPDNVHLQRQALMVNQAQITTIDSFCLSLIRNHFNRLDIDPAFRIGDEGELMLLRADVMEEMLEDHYQADEKDFIRFVETYAVGRGDYGIEDYIMQVYTFSQSNPWPGQWIADCKAELLKTDLEELKESLWMQFLIQDIRLQAKELTIQLEDAMEVCQSAGGPEAYLPALELDHRMLEEFAEISDYETLNRKLSQASFGRLAAIRSKEVDPDQKAYVSGCRDRVKKTVGKWKESYCFMSAEEFIDDMKGTRPAVEMLLSLAEEFSQRYQEKKKEKNLVDFPDLEHYAIQVLTEEQDGKRVPSQVADELSRQYVEILVDEYQDSNQVQETLIQCVSRERFGQPNVFMVGDVKQSIYKFRLARPELFLEKYHTYSSQESMYQKIELHQNFRSRELVLQGINEVFHKIMTENLGNIEYTQETALHPGAIFQECEGRTATEPELLMVNTNGDLLKQLDEENADYTAKELEARLIAAQIRQMTDSETGLMVWDKEEGRYRIARCKDMVILLRSLSGWSEVFVNVLMNEGIPAYAETRTGYFTTTEVETVLSMLAVLDNPMNDIPLTSALKSPMGGLSDWELAAMMAVYKKLADKGQNRGIYGAFCHYMDLEDADVVLQEKLHRFSDLVKRLRKKSTYLPIHQLLEQLFYETGYADYVAAMPGGETRKANLDMLVQKAAAYEKTSYKGLFHFIRYIEKLKKFNTDFGEAAVVGEHDDTVRIMSIHKSKGLEFPVVFLAAMGKGFNRQDAYSKILIDPDLGIGTDYLDLENRLKTSTLKKQVLKRRMELESLGEELRVLYVAMTRAKEKLVMTATDRYLEHKQERYRHVPLSQGRIPFTILSSAGCYLDWMLMSLETGQTRIQVKEIPVEELVGAETARQITRQVTKEMLLHFPADQEYAPEYGAWIRRTLAYAYPFQADIGLHTKVSVSELKQLGQTIDEQETTFLPTIPDFLKEEQEIRGGASAGTAYHRSLELLDFGKMDSRQQVEDALDQLVEEKKLTMENRNLVHPGPIWKFLCSPLGQRMKTAMEEGRLHKEQQFVFGIPARQIRGGESEELVLIQGIMDAYMEEADGLVLVDYKTDHVGPGQEKQLIDHYQVQLDYYQKALEQMTGKPVKEKWIYSLTMGKEVLL